MARLSTIAMVSATAIVAGTVSASAATYEYTVTATVTVGASPGPVAVDSGAHRAYIANSAGGVGDSVSVVDTVSKTVVATVPVGLLPTAVAVNPSTHRVYVLNASDRTVTVIDEATNSTISTVSVGGMSPSAIAVDSVTNQAYVTDKLGGQVFVISGAANKVTGSIGVGIFPAAVTVDSLAHRVYVADDGEITVIDPTTNTVVASIPAGDENRTVGVDTSTGDIYLTTGICEILQIDGITHAVTTVANVCVGTAISVDSTTHTVYVAILGPPKDELLVIDGVTKKVSATLSIGPSPQGVAVDASRHQVYATAQSGNSVSVIRQSAPATPAPAHVTVDRIAGADRYGTAVEVSKASFPDGGASSVVLATGDDYPDALVGTPLAKAKNAPLLLTVGNTLPAVTRAELLRVLEPGDPVYLLGGTRAIPPSIADEVAALGYQVSRIGGPDRYRTATAVADALGNPPTVLLASGLAFADAMSAGPAAAHTDAAVLLTAGTRMPAATGSYLTAHPVTVYAIGGPAAAAAGNATTIVGTDRYETAAEVAARFFAGPWHVGIATGNDFPDGLTGGCYLAKNGWPLLLAQGGGLPSSSGLALSGFRSALGVVDIFGGSAVLDPGMQATVGWMLNG